MVNAARSSARKILVAATTAAPEYLHGITRHARERGWHLVLDMMFTGALPRGWNGDGVLAFLPYQPELLVHLQATGVPCVACTTAEQPANVPRIESDHSEIGRLAADHLLERAHRSFAWAPFLNDAANRDRFAAFQSRLAEHGCTCRPLPPTHIRIGPYWQDHWAERRRTLIAELQRLPRPAAVFAFNDCVAADVIDACHDAGIAVPEELAVLGVGNSIVSETSLVPLSSVDEDMEEIGFRAATLLEDLMSDVPAPSLSVRVPPRGIVTRVSTDVIAVAEPRVARALRYIAEHYPDPMLTVGEVAEAVGMSRRNLERSFRSETGITINEHIVGIRMREASRLLKAQPRATSSEIAALVGIVETGTFFRTFRRYFGMSPGLHRDWAAHSSLTGQSPNAVLHPLESPARKPRETAAGIRSTAA